MLSVVFEFYSKVTDFYLDSFSQNESRNIIETEEVDSASGNFCDILLECKPSTSAGKCYLTPIRKRKKFY